MFCGCTRKIHFKFYVAPSPLFIFVGKRNINGTVISNSYLGNSIYRNFVDVCKIFTTLSSISRKKECVWQPALLLLLSGLLKHTWRQTFQGSLLHCFLFSLLFKYAWSLIALNWLEIPGSLACGWHEQREFLDPRV